MSIIKHDKCNRAIWIMNRDIVTYYSTAICIYLHGLYAKKRAEVMISRLLFILTHFNKCIFLNLLFKQYTTYVSFNQSRLI